MDVVSHIIVVVLLVLCGVVHLRCKVFYLRMVESIIELGWGGGEKANRFGSPSGDGDSLGSVGSCG